MKVTRQSVLLVLFSGVLLGPAIAQDPVYFPDANLKAAVEEALWPYDPTPADMRSLREFSCVNRGVKDITGLEYAENLQLVNLRFNEISDISPLSGLSNLQNLSLSRNQIGDLSALSGLSRLHYLDLHGNQLSNISVLSGLTSLRTLVLRFNRLSNISALSGLGHLEHLDLHENLLSDVSALSELTKMQNLDLYDNQIADISVLSEMTALQYLDLRLNEISDVSVLCRLKGLTRLYLGHNHINTIAPLAHLTYLRDLYLQGNPINDISALLGLTNLQTLDLRWNPLDNDFFCSYLAMIIQDNPDLVYFYEGGCDSSTQTAEAPAVTRDSATQITESSAVLRARVVSDGAEACEGRFRYWVPDQCESTTPWQDALYSDMTFSQEITGLLPDSIYNFAAELRNSAGADLSDTGSFTSAPDTFVVSIYVDDDAPLDPQPYDLGRGDPLEDGSADHPFDSLQEAIEAAAQDDLVLVKPGTYHESINLMGKNIGITGIDPNHAEISALPVIDGNDTGTIVTFSQGEDSTCQLSGFVLTRGRDETAGAIACLGSSPTIRHCLITGNRCDGPYGAIVYCQDSNSVFENITIHGNDAGDTGAAFRFVDCNAVVTNSILWGNLPSEIVVESGQDPIVTYSNVLGTWPGSGNIEVNPEFARPGFWTADLLAPHMSWISGDYHLMSETGRWDPNALSWLTDELSSPCIDAGDPDWHFARESAPNGKRINMGVYGGTGQASRSLLPGLAH